MIRKYLYALATAALMFSATACNSDSESSVITYSSASTLISSVKISSSKSPYDKLDSVYFSIDQVEARIFNADSLPFGTRQTCFTPEITTNNASKVELYIPRENNTDTIIDYLNNRPDSVDFSKGPIRIKVTAADGEANRTYTMYLNIHQVKSDTLVWRRAQQANLPSTFMIPERQGTAATSSAIYCLTSSEGKYCIARADNPSASWTTATPSFSFTPRVESLSATSDALYVLATDGSLYKSTNGTDWAATGQRWDNIYGNYGTELWGSVNNNGNWQRVSYPTGKVENIPAAFPVSNTSQTINYVFEMSTRPQVLITGGVTASGVYSGYTWGYDGKSWACLSSEPMAEPLKDPVVVPYFVSKFDESTMRTTRNSALLAMFGQRQDGTLNDTVYISKDFGLSWQKAGDELQMSKSFPARTMARGFVYTETVSSRSSASNLIKWTELGVPRLPFGAVYDEKPASRAVYPLTSWDCPYIYIFGGVSENGSTYNTVWRGVISAFTFRPLY